MVRVRRTANNSLHDIDGRNQRMELECTRRIRCQKTGDLNLQARDVRDDKKSVSQISIRSRRNRENDEDARDISNNQARSRPALAHGLNALDTSLFLAQVTRAIIEGRIVMILAVLAKGFGCSAVRRSGDFVIAVGRP
jgi:hypothetical protein